MKMLVLDAYRIFFYITGAKVFSYVCAILLITVFNLILLTGFCMLLDGILPVKEIAGIFSFPKNILLGLVLAGITAYYAPLGFVEEVVNSAHRHYTRLILFFVISLIIVGYLVLPRFV